MRAALRTIMFPVTNSQPHIMRIINPTGNVAPITNCLIPGSDKLVFVNPNPTATATHPPNPINIPPAIARIIVLNQGRPHFFKPASSIRDQAWSGVRYITSAVMGGAKGPTDMINLFYYPQVHKF